MTGISITGSTGSIGTQTIDVASRLGLKVTALSAGRNVEMIERQARELKPLVCALADEDAARELRVKLADTDIRVLSGEEGVCEAACTGDTCVASASGVAGLAPTVAAVKAGMRVAIANKETLVCAGEYVMSLTEKTGAVMLPVDSEHSAVFQCIEGHGREHLKRIILTASGGPFFGRTRKELENVTPAEALAHPNWSMGPKVTVDSATMMNKGLEVIEAMRLYNVPEEMVDVVVHRESIVHSMVEFADGAVLAQLSVPDMRLPIQYALTYPKRVPSPVKQLDLVSAGKLTFFEPDNDAFPCLPLAREAAKRGGTACAAMNGANEAVVSLFLNGKIRFYDIPELIRSAMDAVPFEKEPELCGILAADTEARKRVFELAAQM